MIGPKLKTAPPTGYHVFQRIGTTFELNQDIIKTNILTNFVLGRDFIGTKLLTKFHEDGTRNVASRMDGRTYDGQRPVTKAHRSNQWETVFVNKSFRLDNKGRMNKRDPKPCHTATYSTKMKLDRIIQFDPRPNQQDDS
ncbi:hypothetical protein DPMN_109624 [Dreissena polymorpha]|uniref:Uncharacterized protein n=1 Tax=Dreissena polymorpha TaxID=45954 RepID=A0A9D4KB52_DREPO|nr:hypothetical protein DPMN_109624 [Dreissena polymorpha]